MTDTADAIDPNADDPTPDEVTDPQHPDYVEPDSEAQPVDDNNEDEQGG